MSDFLSPAWIDDLDRAMRASSFTDAGPDPTPFVIEQRVATPAGEVCYHLVLERSESRAAAGAAAAPNLVIVTDYETAADLLNGGTNAQHAIADGRMKIRGDLHAIARRIGALAELDDVFAAVRDATTVDAAAVDAAGA